MTPAKLSFHGHGVHLYVGDCRQLPAGLGPFDFIAADPPYQQTAFPWDRWPHGWAFQLLSRLKPAGSMWCFGSLRRFVSMWSEFAGWSLVDDAVWEKHNGTGGQHVAMRRLNRVHEQLVRLAVDGVPWESVYSLCLQEGGFERKCVRRQAPPGGHVRTFGQSEYDSEFRYARSVIAARSMHGRALGDTEKPLELVALLADTACPPAGWVLVPFLGAGPDVEVALRAGRTVVGVDVQPSQVELTIQRVRRVVEELIEERVTADPLKFKGAIRSSCPVCLATARRPCRTPSAGPSVEPGAVHEGRWRSVEAVAASGNMVLQFGDA